MTQSNHTDTPYQPTPAVISHELRPGWRVRWVDPWGNQNEGVLAGLEDDAEPGWVPVYLGDTLITIKVAEIVETFGDTERIERQAHAVPWYLRWVMAFAIK